MLERWGFFSAVSINALKDSISLSSILPYLKTEQHRNNGSHGKLASPIRRIIGKQLGGAIG